MCEPLGVTDDDIDTAIGNSIRLCLDILDGKTETIGIRGRMMMKKRVFLTGATGGMGLAGLNELLKDTDQYDIVILARSSIKNMKLLAPYVARKGLDIVWGDLCDYDDVLKCVKGTDMVLHVAAFVSPEADYHPKSAMEINFGSTMNILSAIKELGQTQTTRLVYIGTIAETGDRMPPIHWGRVGDPLKPSVFDYYAVSKVASERAVIESGLQYWVSLRQTGILSKRMTEIEDAIMFHNCLDNVLEYISDRDSGILLRHICQDLPDTFWGHIYNIGGGAGCRTSAWQMYQTLFGKLGITDVSTIMDSKWFATRNFHGHFYLDADRLENCLHFRHDSMQYYYDSYLKGLGGKAGVSCFVCKLPFGQKIIGSSIKKKFLKTARTEHGPVHFIDNNLEGHIAAYFGSREAWERILPINQFQHFMDWDTVVPIDHGYDENKPESELTLEDVVGAARFRGGSCLSPLMKTGDWTTRLLFRCAFGHPFEASPRLVLEGGHWCDTCERESWNYYERAKRDPFFAQVWYPLHDRDEKEWIYPKDVNELDVTYGRRQAPAPSYPFSL